jgi:hypothetical protein
MPGLLRGVARTAVIRRDGHRRVQPRLATAGRRWSAQEQQQAHQQQPYEAPPPPTNDMDAKLDQLERLGELKSQGVLSEAEFQAQKQRILGS